MTHDPDGTRRASRSRTDHTANASKRRRLEDPEGEGRQVRKSIVERIAAQRKSARIQGTNGSWPTATGKRNADPAPPPICMLYEDLLDPEDLPEAVFGQYPVTLIPKVLPWLRCKRAEVLHVCSGALHQGEGIRVDVRREARPDVLADGRALPFADGSIAAVMLDPPYTVQYAQDLYGVEYPRPSHLLREAARVVRPCGRIAFVHYLVPKPPPGCNFVRVLGLSTGFGFPIRAVTIFEREQDGLFGEASP